MTRHALYQEMHATALDTCLPSAALHHESKLTRDSEFNQLNLSVGALITADTTNAANSWSA